MAFKGSLANKFKLDKCLIFLIDDSVSEKKITLELKKQGGVYSQKQVMQELEWNVLNKKLAEAFK